jgi:hypothetical protein
VQHHGEVFPISRGNPSASATRAETPGSLGSFGATVINSGTETSPPSYIRIGLDNHIVVGFLSWNTELAPGQTVSPVESGFKSFNLRRGAHTVAWYIDPANVIQETDDFGDNVGAFAFICP